MDESLNSLQLLTSQMKTLFEEFSQRDTIRADHQNDLIIRQQEGFINQNEIIINLMKTNQRLAETLESFARLLLKDAEDTNRA
jgi:hypothetical protein